MMVNDPSLWGSLAAREQFMRTMIAACESKTPYPKERDALMAADGALRKFRRTLFPYRCRACGDWHLTKQRQRAPLGKGGDSE